MIWEWLERNLWRNNNITNFSLVPWQRKSKSKKLFSCDKTFQNKKPLGRRKAQRQITKHFISGMFLNFISWECSGTLFLTIFPENERYSNFVPAGMRFVPGEHSQGLEFGNIPKTELPYHRHTLPSGGFKVRKVLLPMIGSVFSPT